MATGTAMAGTDPGRARVSEVVAVAAGVLLGNGVADGAAAGASAAAAGAADLLVAEKWPREEARAVDTETVIGPVRIAVSATMHRETSA